MLTITAVSFLLCGCAETSPADYMILDEVVFVERFPQTVKLEEPVQVNVEVLGGTKFVIVDSTLIFSSSNPKGMWSFFSFPDCDMQGSFLSKGNGPNEFVSPPWVGTNTSFYRSHKDLCAAIYDFQKGKVFEMNVDRTLAENQLSMRLIKDSLPPFLSAFVMIDSVTFYCRAISENATKQERFLLRNGAKIIPDIFECLNKSAVKPGEDFNILAAMIKRNSKHELFVEMPLKLNYINIYSVDGTIGRTLCVGEKLDNINEIQALDMADRIYRHGDLRVYDNFFGILCVNEDEKTYEFGRKKLPVIQCFNLKGEPLVELLLSYFATSFEIDPSGYLYTYDYKTEEFYQYDTREIFNAIL